MIDFIIHVILFIGAMIAAGIAWLLYLVAFMIVYLLAKTILGFFGLNKKQYYWRKK